MTKEEAIKYLIKPVVTSTEIGEEKQKEFEAYNLAISALSAEPIKVITDDTIEVRYTDFENIKRIILTNGDIFCKMFYEDNTQDDDSDYDSLVPDEYKTEPSDDIEGDIDFHIDLKHNRMTVFNNITESPNDVVEKNDEVIERPIIEHDKEWIIGCIKHDGFIKTDRFDKANQIILDALADRPTHDCTNLVQWLLEETMDEESWRENADANGEIICRKLKKLGVLDTKDGYYIRTPLAYDDRPSGECDLISRADVIEAVYKLLWNEPPYCDSEALCRERAKEIVNALPSADAVSRVDTVTLNSPISIQADMVAVVRCKDCVWGKEWNDKQIFCDRILMRLRENDFCSYGEREEE